MAGFHDKLNGAKGGRHGRIVMGDEYTSKETLRLTETTHGFADAKQHSTHAFSFPYP